MKKSDENVAALVISIILAALFWYQTGKTFETHCFGPAPFWADYAKYYYIIISITSAISLYFLQMEVFKDHPKPELPKAFNIVKIITGVAGLPLMFGAVTSFMHSDECPELYVITTIHFAISLLAIVTLGLGLCCACCCLGLGVGAIGALVAFLKLGGSSGQTSSTSSSTPSLTSSSTSSTSYSSSYSSAYQSRSSLQQPPQAQSWSSRTAEQGYKLV